VALTVGAAGEGEVAEIGLNAAEHAGEDHAENAGDHIVLGKSVGLAERAAQIGGRHLMNDPNWDLTVLKGVADPGTKFSAALDDVEGGSVYGRVMSAVQRWCSEPEPNLIESSAGFSVRVLGRTGRSTRKSSASRVRSPCTRTRSRPGKVMLPRR
jgi:hypothetical protein